MSKIIEVISNMNILKETDIKYGFLLELNDIISRFNEEYFLSDTDSESKIQLLKELKRFLEHHCKPYLEDIGNYDNAFARGMQSTKLVLEKSPRENRKPKNSPLFLHNAVVSALRSAGAIANRDNSFFGVKSRSIAAEYGTPYSMFPVGEYHSTYIEGVNDLTVDSSNLKLLKGFFEKRPKMIRRRYKSLGKLIDELDKAKIDNPDYYNKVIDDLEKYLTRKLSEITVVEDISNIGKEQEVFLKANSFIFVRYNIMEDLLQHKDI